MSKTILFDIAHPAQIHQFKHIYRELEAKGWQCVYIAKDKDIAISLLEEYGLKYELISKSQKGKFRKILQIPKDYISFWRYIRKYNPKLVLNRFSIHSSHISWLCGIPTIGFSDTEHAAKFHKLTRSFVNTKFSPLSYYNTLGKNHFRFNSTIEFFYLHPTIFKPDPDIRIKLGVDENEKYCIVRFVSWQAHHDAGVKHMNLEQKIDLVELLSKKYRVFISVEGGLPQQLESYKLKIKPSEMHSALQQASLYIGEGGTMASEAACLNTPVIYTNPLPLMGYLREQQGFGLLHHLTDFNDIVTCIEKESYLQNRRYDEYMSSKINPTKFFVWFIENYPESEKIIIENPDYQYNFK